MPLLRVQLARHLPKADDSYRRTNSSRCLKGNKHPSLHHTHQHPQCLLNHLHLTGLPLHMAIHNTQIHGNIAYIVIIRIGAAAALDVSSGSLSALRQRSCTASTEERGTRAGSVHHGDTAHPHRRLMSLRLPLALGMTSMQRFPH